MFERDVGGVRQPVVEIAIDEAMTDLLHDALLEPVAQLAHAAQFVLKMFRRQCRGFAKTDDARHILRAATAAALLMAAADERLELDALAHIERADSFRPMQLVTRQRQHSICVVFKSSGSLADRLHCIGMEQRARRMRHFASWSTGKTSRSHCSPT